MISHAPKCLKSALLTVKISLPCPKPRARFLQLWKACYLGKAVDPFFKLQNTRFKIVILVDYVTHHAGLTSTMNAIMHLRCVEIVKRPIKGGAKGEIMIVHDLFGKGEVGKRALPLHQNRASADKIAIDQMSCKPLSAQMNVPLAVGTDGGRNEVSVPINDVGVGVDECWA